MVLVDQETWDQLVAELTSPEPVLAEQWDPLNDF